MVERIHTELELFMTSGSWLVEETRPRLARLRTTNPPGTKAHDHLCATTMPLSPTLSARVHSVLSLQPQYFIRDRDLYDVVERRLANPMTHSPHPIHHRFYLPSDLP
jgi:hypothetical protein